MERQEGYVTDGDQQSGRSDLGEGVSHEVSEQQQELHNLRASLERLHEDLRAAGVGLWELDLPTHRVHAAALADVLGYEEGEIDWDVPSLKELIHPEDIDQHLKLHDECCNGNRGEYLNDFRMRDRQGQWRWIRVQGRVIAEDDEGNPERIAGMYQDVTEQKQHELDRIETMRRAAELQKLESLSVLAGGIAHDFNNLLMVISGNTEMALMQKPTNPVVLESLHEIHQAAGQAANLSNQMRYFSGKGHTHIQPIPINETIRRALRWVQEAKRGFEHVELSLENDLPPVLADEGQIEQMIINLLLNAHEATDSGAGRIELSSRLVEVDQSVLREMDHQDEIPEGKYVELGVADGGEGMEADVLERVFEPFFSTRFVGRGLGLAAVLGIVRGHRGAITVDSQPGNGAAFRVLLPCAESLPQPARRDEASARNQHGTVLVVDDEEAVLSVSCRMLQARGYQALSATSGPDALELFEANAEDIELVLLDYSMPEMDGEAVFREIRRRSSDMPVVICTGYGEDKASERFQDEKKVWFLPKPFQIDRLTAIVRESIS